VFGAAIIVLRETFEAALLIGIIAAATRPIAGRSRWIGGGILAGVAGAGVVAAFTGHIAALFDGVGQEIFNAGILALAVFLLGWHNIWMSAHGAELAAGAKKMGGDVTEGRREMSAVLIVVALAVLREGSESALFLYGLMSGGEVSGVAAVTGGAFGLIAGAALGVLLYAGMLRIPMRWFFSVTSALILLLAAGMASRMAQFLIQADLLPSLASPLWDFSSILPVTSPAGAFMHALVGYDAAPAGMQVVFYVVTAVVIFFGMRHTRRTLVDAEARNPQP
jgi:high-affinity iron transporter